MKITTLSLITAVTVCLSLPAQAGPEAFVKGKTIPQYGKIAAVKVDQPVYKHSKFKVVFDVSKETAPGELNRTFVSAARFINMHTAAGVKEKNIHLAIVVHGKAGRDLTRTTYYETHQELEDGETPIANANADLIKVLQAHGVKIYLCGQSAAWYDIKNEDLLPGVKMALSAMTAHALLQQKGYTLNPF